MLGPRISNESASRSRLSEDCKAASFSFKGGSFKGLGFRVSARFLSCAYHRCGRESSCWAEVEPVGKKGMSGLGLRFFGFEGLCGFFCLRGGDLEFGVGGSHG